MAAFHFPLWSPAGLLTVQWFSCLKLFQDLPCHSVQSGLLAQWSCHHPLLTAHPHPQSEVPQLVTLAFFLFLSAHHFPASGPTPLLFPLPGTPSLHQEASSLLFLIHQVQASESLFLTV